MESDFVITSAGEADFGLIQLLLTTEDALSASESCSLTGPEMLFWLNQHVSRVLVARLVSDPSAVIGHVQLCRKFTSSLGSRADLEDLVVHPDFRRRRIGSGLLGAAIWCAEHEWRATRIEAMILKTRLRHAARRLLERADAMPITDTDYRILLPYRPRALMQGYYGAPGTYHHGPTGS